MPRWSRREWLMRAGGGVGALALSALLHEDGVLGQASGQRRNPLAPRAPHFTPRAKRVIWLFMHGGPSQVDLLDPKPELIRWAGQPLPASYGAVMTRRNVAANAL